MIFRRRGAIGRVSWCLFPTGYIESASGEITYLWLHMITLVGEDDAGYFWKDAEGRMFREYVGH